MWSWSWSNEAYSVCIYIRMRVDALLVDSLIYTIRAQDLSRPCAAFHHQNKQVCTFWGFFSHERRVETLLGKASIQVATDRVDQSVAILAIVCSKRAHMVSPCSCIGPSAGFIALETCKTYLQQHHDVYRFYCEKMRQRMDPSDLKGSLSL